MSNSGGVRMFGRGSNDLVVVGCVLGWVVVVECGGVYVILVAVAVWCWSMNVIGILLVWGGLCVGVW